MTSTTQGNGAGSRLNWRVPSQSESPTLARSSCSHLAPLRARLRASRSLLHPGFAETFITPAVEVDAVVVDLESSVAPDDKQQARENAMSCRPR